jgi:hypothetical protein
MTNYHSRNTKEPCSAAHLLTEIMCERKSKKDNMVLGHKFWNKEEWKLFYRRTIIAANKTFKLYSSEVVFRVLKHKKHQWQYSLHEKTLNEALRIEQRNFDKEQQSLKKAKTIDIQPTVIDVKKNTDGSKNKFNKLRD